VIHTPAIAQYSLGGHAALLWGWVLDANNDKVIFFRLLVVKA